MENRDWQKDKEAIEQYGDTELRYRDTIFAEMLPYWMDQVKQLKEDNVRWICKHTAAEQKYQTQSNVIADLRGRAEKAEVKAENWRMEAFRKYPTPEAYEAACAALEKHRVRADQAEEREQKLKEAIHEAASWTWGCGEDNMTEVVGILSKVIDTLYPLDKEETNEMDHV